MPDRICLFDECEAVIPPERHPNVQYCSDHATRDQRAAATNRTKVDERKSQAEAELEQTNFHPSEPLESIFNDEELTAYNAWLTDKNLQGLIDVGLIELPRSASAYE